MELTNSYIFLKNPYSKEDPTRHRSKDGTITLTFRDNLFNYIEKSFATITKVDCSENFYHKKYVGDITYDNIICKAEFFVTEVVDTMYLDISVTGKTKIQTIKCLEFIQETLLSSGVREIYIDIVSYDAISEYYCNKIYPKLNTLERNLRKLLYNIYIVNFGRDYYRTTINEDLQNKIKSVIGSDSNKEEKEQIKNDYKIATRKDAEEINRLQRFFYSLEYSDIQKLLFTPSWTIADESAKNKFLNKHDNLSHLSDKELREAFSKYVPRSDWDRFFSNKINLSGIRDLIEQIRLFRNSVAHFKFFYKSEYYGCDKLVKQLNTAIIKAIRITEDEDFSKKNAEYLSESVITITESFKSYSNLFAEMAQHLIANLIPNTVSAVSALSENLKSFYHTLQSKPSAAQIALTKEIERKENLFRATRQATSLTQGIIPPYISETQKLLKSINSQPSPWDLSKKDSSNQDIAPDTDPIENINKNNQNIEHLDAEKLEALATEDTDNLDNNT